MFSLLIVVLLRFYFVCYLAYLATIKYTNIQLHPALHVQFKPWILWLVFIMDHLAQSNIDGFTVNDHTSDPWACGGKSL